MSGWYESPTGTKPFIAMSDSELKDACYIRVLNQFGTRAELIARLERHAAQRGGISPTRLRHKQ